MRPVLRRPALSHAQRWLLASALWAVLVARSLALLHGVVHPVGSGIADGAISNAASEVPSWAAKALGGHDHGSLTCQLLDQLLHDASPDLVAAPALPPLPALAVEAVPAGRLLAGARAGFHARAPPVLI